LLIRLKTPLLSVYNGYNNYYRPISFNSKREKMKNSESNSVFIPSVLKVTASQDLDISQELTVEKTHAKTIDELLESSEDKPPDSIIK
jgi:hypothetical protein